MPRSYRTVTTKRLMAAANKLDSSMLRSGDNVMLEVKCILCGRVGRTLSVSRRPMVKVVAPSAEDRCTTCGGNVMQVDY